MHNIANELTKIAQELIIQTALRNASDYPLRSFADALTNLLGHRIYDDIDMGSKSFQIYGTGGNWDNAYDHFEDKTEDNLVIMIQGDYDERRDVIEIEVEAQDPESHMRETLGQKKFKMESPEMAAVGLDWEDYLHSRTLSDVTAWIKRVTD